MKNLLIVFGLLFVFACAPIRVTYDYEKTSDFSKYKTYNYYLDLDTGLGELDTNRLLNALDKHLGSKGLTLSETPDFFINIQSADYREAQRSSMGVGIGGTGGNVGGGISLGIPLGQAQMNRVIQFDFINEGGIGLFWQAISESTYNPNATPQEREDVLNAIVIKVLQGYPPKS